MNDRPTPPPPGFMLAVTGGAIGTGLVVLAAMIALGALEAPLPLLAETAVQVVMIALGLVLIAFEVRAVLAFARTRKRPDRD